MPITHDDASTFRIGGAPSIFQENAQVGMTILLHPDIDRVGEVSVLGAYSENFTVQVNRLAPLFQSGHRGTYRPLNTRYLSRKSVTLTSEDGSGVVFDSEAGNLATVNGAPLNTRLFFGVADLQKGVRLLLGNAVLVLVHLIDTEQPTTSDMGLVGQSTAIRKVRANIAKVADLNVSVLLRGETGTGKELVASAIHEHSLRSERAYICVNMAAVPEGIAASELFGHRKGAFTGAHMDHKGYFQKADQGTLFLDEIGDTPTGIQPQLLRAVETGQIPIAGEKAPTRVDVRLVAATDADLEKAIDEGSFRQQLLQRLSGYQIVIPPLRERREDVGRLFAHFLKAECARASEGHKLSEPVPPQTPGLPAAVVEKFMQFDWPGNVRQLQNAVRQLVISNRGESHFRLDGMLQELLVRSGDATADNADASPIEPLPRSRDKSTISDDDIHGALCANGFNLSATAEALGVSRGWLNTRMDLSSRFRKPGDVTAAQIKELQQELGNDVDKMAQILEVTPRGLLLHMKRLGLRKDG
ncbi:MAG: sigma 54-interacting transcriptional regulator [Deltaproteobacteria bacterium]|nr:sigma 54-interacting transcriptional regulator [Deltaproteobacteria bacterium]MBN2672851.1 sigma 54-interacting transcriptional regulator [Deltaproteobacteria bacterium]